MDIVKRAYLKTKEEWQLHGNWSGELHNFHEAVRQEMIRLIKVRGYGRQDWPFREFGPLPEELKKKEKKKS